MRQSFGGNTSAGDLENFPGVDLLAADLLGGNSPGDSFPGGNLLGRNFTGSNVLVTGKI